MRLLTFTTLYPNDEQPNHGVFVENRLRHLVASGEVESSVVAPVAYFPSGRALFGTWGRTARVPRVERRHGLVVRHPRYLVVPKLGMNWAPSLLYRSAARAVRRLMADGQHFDAIDAHYLYPDGVAAVRLGRLLNLPVVVTARGSDVTQLPHYPRPRAAIERAIAGADALITVSASLREGLLTLGAPAERVTVLRNGVDTEAFRQLDRTVARRTLGLSRPTLVSVGHLIERKRHHLTIEAMVALPECELLIAGDGPERERLAALVTRLGLDDRVRLLGGRPHAELAELYSAADVMVLASSREGWANVLLEAMACGTPVVAFRIGGNAEVVRTRQAGLIAEIETSDSIASCVRDLLAAPPVRVATRAYAEGFGWDETTAGQIALFRRVIAARAAAKASAQE